MGGLALANHVLFFQSPIEEGNPSQATWSLYQPPPLDDSMQWALYAVDAGSGDVLARIVFSGRAVGSPIVTGGRVYVTLGNVALPFIGFNPAGGVVQLRLPRAGRGRGAGTRRRSGADGYCAAETGGGDPRARPLRR